MFRKRSIIIYTLKLGSGGNGVVYAAKNAITQELLAVKVIQKK